MRWPGHSHSRRKMHGRWASAHTPVAVIGVASACPPIGYSARAVMLRAACGRTRRTTFALKHQELFSPPLHPQRHDRTRAPRINLRVPKRTRRTWTTCRCPRP